MNKQYLIPIAVAATGCAAPDYVGDWELTRFEMRNQGAYGAEITVQRGDLSIQPDGDAELELAFEAKYSWEYCYEYYYDDDYYYYDCEDGEYVTDYLIAVDGDAEDWDGDEFELELDGDLVYSDEDGGGYGYWTELDLDCEVDGATMTCDGFLRVDGYSQPVELDFRAR